MTFTPNSKSSDRRARLAVSSGALRGSRIRSALTAAIFDVDGVLLSSPHEQAWREALAGFTDPARLTSALYQMRVAGRPRLDGARAALEALGVADAARIAPLYAEAKQARLAALVASAPVPAFPDALRLVHDLRELGWPLAAASSSRNASDLLRRTRLSTGETLASVFSADVCGVPTAGKPAPDLFLLAAQRLGTAPERCVVMEDAAVGVAAARAAGMASVGVARRGDTRLLRDAGADVVVRTLDELSRRALARGALIGRLRRR